MAAAWRSGRPLPRRAEPGDALALRPVLAEGTDVASGSLRRGIQIQVDGDRCRPSRRPHRPRSRADVVGPAPGHPSRFAVPTPAARRRRPRGPAPSLAGMVPARRSCKPENHGSPTRFQRMPVCPATRDCELSSCPGHRAREYPRQQFQGEGVIPSSVSARTVRSKTPCQACAHLPCTGRSRAAVSRVSGRTCSSTLPRASTGVQNHRGAGLFRRRPRPLLRSRRRSPPGD